MFLSQWSVRRPIAMTALIIVLVMIGITLYPRITIDLLPNMEVPMVLVRCEYQGASRRKSRLKSSSGSRTRSLRWTESSTSPACRWKMRPAPARIQHGHRCRCGRHRYPRSAEPHPRGPAGRRQRATIRKIDTNATTVAQVFLVGDRTQDDLYDYADDVIADRFSSVPGVGEVRVYGANEMQIPRPAGPRKTDRNEPVDQRCRHEAQGEQRP